MNRRTFNLMEALWQEASKDWPEAMKSARFKATFIAGVRAVLVAVDECMEQNRSEFPVDVMVSGILDETERFFEDAIEEIEAKAGTKQ